MKNWLLALLASIAVLPGEEAKKFYPPEVSSLESSEIADFEQNPPAVKTLLQSALALTKKNLGYQFGSADPNQKGMDCSGTVYFLLREAGIKDVPRSSAEQYRWVEKKRTFRAVQAKDLNAADFSELKPGDLLFWKGTYATSAAASHAMIYLGKAKEDGLPLMVGASDGRTFRGKKKYGVSVFEFYLPKAGSKSQFLGYAPIPGLVKTQE